MKKTKQTTVHFTEKEWEQILKCADESWYIYSNDGIIWTNYKIDLFDNYI